MRTVKLLPLLSSRSQQRSASRCCDRNRRCWDLLPSPPAIQPAPPYFLRLLRAEQFCAFIQLRNWRLVRIWAVNRLKPHRFYWLRNGGESSLPGNAAYWGRLGIILVTPGGWHGPFWWQAAAVFGLTFFWNWSSSPKPFSYWIWNWVSSWAQCLFGFILYRGSWLLSTNPSWKTSTLLWIEDIVRVGNASSSAQ